MAAIAPLPPELEHAERHITAARAEWEAGKMEMAAMHLREAIADAGWALYYTFAGRDPWPHGDDQVLVAARQLRAATSDVELVQAESGQAAGVELVRTDSAAATSTSSSAAVDVDPE